MTKAGPRLAAGPAPVTTSHPKGTDMSIRSRVRDWFDYDVDQDRRLAQRSAAVDLDIALAGVQVTREQVADAIRRGTTHLRYDVSVLKPRDIDRATAEVMRLLEPPVPYWPADDDLPSGEHGDITAIRDGVTR